MATAISIIIFIIIICLIVKSLILQRNPYFTYSEAVKDTLSTEPNPVINEIKTYEPTGFVFGQKNIHFITKKESEEGHILVIGGSGSGKSSCLIIPTLLSWKARVFTIDIKGELKEKTAIARKNIKYFQPSDPNSFGYDPFYFLKTTDNKAEAIDDIVNILIPLPVDVKDPYWIESARSVFKAVLLYYTRGNWEFVEILKEILNDSIQNILQYLLRSDNTEIKGLVVTYSSLDEKQLASIWLEITNKLRFFIEDKELYNALLKDKEKTFTPYDLENDCDIYICIQEYNLERWRTLTTLIVNQFLKFFERRDEAKKDKPILFLLDEFARLGKIGSIINGLGTLRSKGISICLVVQSLSQIEKIYGVLDRKSVADNCTYKAILGVSDPDSQQYFSRLAGKQPKTVQTVTTNTGNDNKGVATSQIEVPIIKPESLSYMEKILLFAPAKERYMWVQRTPYYSHSVFQKMINNAKIMEEDNKE